ncbi:MAG: hypothetical protein PVI01_08365 [Gemmatimonadales bacterium]|jgi:hypothetical protein
MSGGESAKRDGKRRHAAAESLNRLVEQEARRLLSAEQLEGDPARIADGWERRFIADAQRAKEAMELYERLGYEVCADPVAPDDVGEDCGDCQLLAALQFKVIYTRRRPPTSK